MSANTNASIEQPLLLVWAMGSDRSWNPARSGPLVMQEGLTMRHVAPPSPQYGSHDTDLTSDTRATMFTT